MLLVPLLQAVLIVEGVRTFLALRPPHPPRLGTLHYTNHLSWLR